MWALADYLSVMGNAITMDEYQPITFLPQSWTMGEDYDGDGFGAPEMNRYWTDCNLTFARLAAFLFIILAFMVRFPTLT